MKARRFSAFASRAAGALLLASTAAAHALVAELDTFVVIKNGSALFVDTFSDGIPPPSAPSEFASYLFPRGIGGEVGGILRLTPATAPISTNAAGGLSQTARATLATNVAPVDLVNGLKNSPMVFGAVGVFNLVAPGAGETYGVRFADRRPDGTFDTITHGDDVVEVSVVGTASGAVVRMRSQDFVHGVIGVPQTVALPGAVFSAADQIALALIRANPFSNEVTGAFALLNDGVRIGTPYYFAGTETIFTGENWTRAEFLASQPVIPEPEVYAMMLAGIGLIGWQLRRRARRAASLRLG